MRTQETLDQVILALQNNCGDRMSAARDAGISLMFLEQWLRDDPKVKEQVTEAERVGVQGIYTELVRRSVHGIQKGIYYKGERVDEETVYSDSLLSKLADAKLANHGFGKEASGGNVFNGPTQINLMPRAANYDEWLAMKATTLAAREADSAPQLPAPSTPDEVADLQQQVEDAVYELVRNPLEGLGL